MDTLDLFAASFAAAYVLFHHYLFSFQRLTLGIARLHTDNLQSAAQVQILMTPTWIGILGWSLYPFIATAAALLWWRFNWVIGLGFVPAAWFLSGFIPVFQFRSHYCGLAEKELTSNLIRAGAGDDEAYGFITKLLQNVKHIRRERVAIR